MSKKHGHFKLVVFSLVDLTDVKIDFQNIQDYVHNKELGIVS